MKIEDMKSLWDSVESNPKSNAEILEMVDEKRHPVLRGIKHQIIIESLGWLAFLLCYYSMFDGGEKPLLINFLLVLSILTPFIHNFYGYILAKHNVELQDVVASLRNHIKRMKNYAFRSVVTRVVFTTGLLIFFAYNMNISDNKEYVILVLALIVIAVQVIVLSLIWKKRIKQLQAVLKEFL